MQCEAQVLEFVLSYIRSTELEESMIRTLFSQVAGLRVALQTSTNSPQLRSVFTHVKYSRGTPTICPALRVDLQVHFAYLPSARLAALHDEVALPRDLLLEGALARLRLQAGMKPAAEPRFSYCSCSECGVPGSSTHAEVSVHLIWDQLVTHMTVRVRSLLAIASNKPTD